MKKKDFYAALTALKNGEVIIYPTDTLYALGADIYNEAAVKKIFMIKRRPSSIPLPIAVPSMKAIETVAYMNESARKICKRFLPGPITIILKKRPSVPDILTSGSDTIALRIPDHPIALRLLQRYGPLTATSANLHHKKTLGIIKDILIQLDSDISVALHDGRLEGVASTIVDLTSKKPHLTRQGSITEKELHEVISHR